MARTAIPLGEYVVPKRTREPSGDQLGYVS
jgi:hypothetical protein